MGSALVVALVKYGLLALLWVFVLVAVSTIRTHLLGPRPAKAAPVRAPTEDEHRKGTPLIQRVTDGALQESTLTLGSAPITLERGHDCTLVIADDYASTHHAPLVPSPEGW